LIGYAEEPLIICKSLVPQVKRGFNNICEKILGSEEAAVDAYLQLEAFRRKKELSAMTWPSRRSIRCLHTSGGS
jgi:hypothetical protein